jgi:hypothetical protein
MSRHETVELEYGIRQTPILEGKAVMLVRGGDMSNTAVDVFAGQLINLIKEWEPGKNLYLLLHMAHPKQGFTPYGRAQVEKSYSHIPPTVRGYAAVLLPNTLVFRMVSLFIQHRKIKHANVSVRPFTDEAEALQWLREQMSPSK